MQLAAFEKHGIAEDAARSALRGLIEACDPKAIPSAASKRLIVAQTGPDAIAACEALAADLRAGPAVLALDSEHNKSGTLSGLLCALQASTLRTDVVFDLCEEDVRLALSGLDGPLAALLSDAKSLKLLHGCNNDAVWLATNLGVAVSPPILDTQEAARCCSMPTTAFGALATELLVEASTGRPPRPDKRFQTSDWRRRPMPADMMAYARDDTRLLLPALVTAAAAVGWRWRHKVAFRLNCSEQTILPEAELARAAAVAAAAAAAAAMDAGGTDMRAVLAGVAMNLFVPRARDREEVESAGSSGGEADWRSLLAAECAPAAGKDAARLHAREMGTGLAGAWSDALAPATSGSVCTDDLVRTATEACAAAGWDEVGCASALASRPGAAGGAGGGMTRDRLAMKRARGAKALIPRRTRMYDNIEMWDAPPNDALLAKVGRRKAVWYLSRDLGYFQLTTGERAVLLELGARGEAAAAAKASELGLSMTAGGGADAREEDVSRFVTEAPPAGDNGLPPGVSASDFTSGEVFSALGRAMMELDAAGAARAAADPGKLRPVRLRLRQPARGKGMGGDAFHLEDKVNCCVVCGSAERLTRLYVVPKPIRVCMPPQCKSHNSHDVVLCCTSCNVVADSELSAHVRAWLSRLGVSSGRAATQELCRKSVSRIAAGALVVGGAAGGGMASWSDSPLPLAPVSDAVRAWQSVMDKADLGASAPAEGLMEVLRCVVETGPVWGPNAAGPDGRPLGLLADPADAAAAAGAASAVGTAVEPTVGSKDNDQNDGQDSQDGKDAEGGTDEDDDDEDDEVDEADDDDDDEDDEDAKLPLARRIALAGARRVLPLLLAGARLAGSERRSPPAAVLARARQRAALLVTVMAPADSPVPLDAALPAAKKLRSLSKHNSTDGAVMLVDAMAAGTVSLADLAAALDSDLTVVPCVEPPRIEAFLAANGWPGASAADGASPAPGSPASSLSERASLSLFVSERANGKAFAARAVRLLVAGPSAALGLERCSEWAAEEAALSPEEANGVTPVTALGAPAERRLNQFVRSFRQHFKDRMQPKALQRNWSVDYPAVLDKGGK